MPSMSRLGIVLTLLVFAACGGQAAEDAATQPEEETTTVATTAAPTTTTTTTAPITTTTASTTTTTLPPETTTTTSTLPGGLDVTFHTEILFKASDDSVWESAVFTAEGPAVDAGVICAEGTLNLGGFDTGIGTWRREVRYICDDGTGEFDVALDLKVKYTSEGYTETGPWVVSYGFGDYETLAGMGIDVTTMPEPSFYVSVQEGQLASG